MNAKPHEHILKLLESQKQALTELAAELVMPCSTRTMANVRASVQKAIMFRRKIERQLGGLSAQR